MIGFWSLPFPLISLVECFRRFLNSISTLVIGVCVCVCVWYVCVCVVCVCLCDVFVCVSKAEKRLITKAEMRTSLWPSVIFRCGGTSPTPMSDLQRTPRQATSPYPQEE